MKYEKLGKYLLLEKLSESGFNESFLARSLVADGLNKFFIVNRMPSDAPGKQNKTSLSHINIHSIFDSGIDKGYYYNVLDYFESYNLRQILQDFREAGCQLSIDQCLYIAREAAAAMTYAHNNSAYGNTSPQSIFVGLDGSIKVVDFISGKISDEKTQSDIYSLGSLLNELLAENRRATSELEYISSKALNEDVSKSYKSATEFYREVNRYLNIQYPDFSSHDFGDLLLKFYGPGVQNQRSKLIEYANRDFPKTALISVPDFYDTPDKTNTSDSTVTGTKSGLSLPEGFAEIPKPGVKNKISFEKLNRINPFAAEAAPAQPILRRPAPRNPAVQVDEGVEEAGDRSVTTDLSLLVGLALLLTLIGYSYNLTIKRYSKKMVESVNQASAPSDQIILKNGKKAVIENYSAGVITRMRANKQLAFLNIKVSGAPHDTRIFINGKELLEKAPVKLYPIFAGQDTVVSVMSAKTNSFDVKKLNVEAGEVSNVELNLQQNKN